MSLTLPLSHYPNNTKAKPYISTIRKPSLVHISCQQKQIKEGGGIIDRRNVLVGLGLGGLYGTAATLMTSQGLIAIAAPEKHSHKGSSQSQMPALSEFGSQPRVLEKTLRALVVRPKKARTMSKKGKMVEVLVVDGIEIPHNGPVRFDVYVARAHDDVVGPELGEFAGSLVNLPFPRVGGKGVDVQPRGSLELGITGLVKNIEAEDCDKVAVSLVPRLGQVIIGALRIQVQAW